MTPIESLYKRIDIDAEDLKPMATLVIRFSGENLAHVGNAMAEALDQCLEKAPENTTYRGWVMVGTIQTARNNKPINGSGIKFLKDSLATLSKMPDRSSKESIKNSGSTAFAIHIKDGEPMSRIPNSFGLYFSLLDNPQRSFATSKGFLMMGLPLETLQEPTEWFSRTEKLIEILKAEVAWLSPGLWTIPGHLIQSYPSINPNTLIQLLGKNPQIDFPYLYASRSPFSTLPGSFTPDQYSGYLAPAWALWANSHLAQKIKNYPGNKTVIKSAGARFLLSEQVPFEMNDSLYSEWQKNWQALSELHITCSDIEEDISHYFLKRFDAKKFSELESGWVKERKILQEKKALESKILNDFRLLTEAHDPNMLVQAEKILDQVPIGHLLWDLIPALSELIKDDSINTAEITKWLKLTEKHSSEAGAQTVETAATIAAKLNLRDQAIGLLKSFDWKTDLTRVSRMKKNRDFKLLAKDSEFNAILDKYAPAKK